jgi:aspartate kinase
MTVPKVKAGGIIRNERLVKIGVMGAPDRPGLASAVLHGLAASSVNVQFIVQVVDLTEHSHVILCVAEDAGEAATQALQSIKAQLGAQTILSQTNVAIISVFGPDFRERPAIAAAVFESLASVGINIMAISTSISTVSCLIDGGRVEDALVALRERFDLP